MTLLDAKQYNPEKDRRRRNRIIIAIVIVIVIAWVAYHFRNYPERHTVSEFLTTLQQQDFNKAYGLWLRDPDWAKHPDKYKTYSFNDFYRDWGPGGQWGVVKNHSIDCSISSGNGVIVEATINQRLEHPFFWVDKDDKALSFSPNDIQCGNWWGWLAE
jgi:hypothetical protein